MKKLWLILVAAVLCLVLCLPATAGGLTISIPDFVELQVGDVYDLVCEVNADNPEYVWYETASGQMQDIIACNRGEETEKSFRVPTDKAGTHYYVCGVTVGDVTEYSHIVTVTVQTTEPVFRTKSLPTATVGQPYSFKIETEARDAVIGVYYNPGQKNEFSDTGLTLADDGTISGTPKKAGSFSFTLIASNDAADAYESFTLTVQTAETATATPVPTAPATPTATTAPVSTDGVVIPVWALTLAGGVVAGIIIALIIAAIFRKR
ncbi:MAG: putative Ig domain-containing protein [Eubacteriales bacterium]|nr:putative Ig domain-containing protein [Eubacteriales bacterium]